MKPVASRIVTAVDELQVNQSEPCRVEVGDKASWRRKGQVKRPTDNLFRVGVGVIRDFAEDKATWIHLLEENCQERAEVADVLEHVRREKEVDAILELLRVRVKEPRD
eukprot:CAMPEP_0179893904 /NCGR_PEP_ID=MMETSP0982-20121206/35012_1 /TAXON_ID=483367 /ORGANISM="non described non described, Strain CCMP 2436" /LENGTH=107 /DNA_ID=CAMNT_0021790481 /DNA_START=178 /DNA_END=501 /DNA_ORIENTATION=+